MDLSKVRAALTGIDEDHTPGNVLEYFPLQSRLLMPPSYFVRGLISPNGKSISAIEVCSFASSTQRPSGGQLRPQAVLPKCTNQKSSKGLQKVFGVESNRRAVDSTMCWNLNSNDR